jgi:hemerythrin-like domain-containing protein
MFRQHIADEESQVLGLLIQQLGVMGAEEEVKVFRKHRPIYELMKRLEDLAALPASELEANQAKLNSLFDEHTAAEEARVFPRAMSLSRQTAR